MPTFQNPTAAARATAIETGTKLYISNLDYSVSNEDIKERFSEVGDLKRHSIHYDRSGRSKGAAEVVFSKRADALAAVKSAGRETNENKKIVETKIPAPAPMVHASVPHDHPFFALVHKCTQFFNHPLIGFFSYRHQKEQGVRNTAQTCT